MRIKNWRVVAALMLALALVAAACGSDDDTDTTSGATGTTAASTGDPLKVAFVHVSPVSDKGWSWAHDQGAKFLEANMNVEVTTLEAIPEGPDSQRVFEDLAAQGNKLIFGTSFGYMDPMLAAADNFPDVAFMHASGFKTGPNMGNYFAAIEEGRYLSGMAAGVATSTNLIGYVAAFPIPEVIRGINAFALGVQEVNSDAKVQVVWTSTWFDPPKEGTAAQSLIDAGADVIAMHQDSTQPGQVADDAGAKWVGYNADTGDVFPNAWLTAPIWEWGAYYLSVAQDVAAGTWQPGVFYGNLADGTVDMAAFGSSVDQATQDLIATRRAEIVAGTFAVFPDPIVDQGGNSRELGDIFGFDYFVEGVIGSDSG
jgi:basic membrane protein A